LELLTAEEVAQILKSSLWFVYKRYKELGGFKIGGLVRFDKEQLFKNIKEVIQDAVPTSRQMDVRLLEGESETPPGRIQDQTGISHRRGNGQKKPKGDEYGLHQIMRKPFKRT
jgi:hypothetical protein